MQPPAGRLHLGDRVETPARRTGRVVGEELVVSNGAWRYTVALDGGDTAQHLDYELKRLPSAA